jgi:hypothetical protein
MDKIIIFGYSIQNECGGWVRLKAGGEGLTMELGSVVKETLVKKKTKGRRGLQVAKSRKPSRRCLDLWWVGISNKKGSGGGKHTVIIVVRCYLWWVWIMGRG